MAPDGRFDTNNLDEIKRLHWSMPEAPLTAVPIEIFMRQYYEPRLLARTMAGEKLPPLPSIATLNRVQPRVFVAAPQAEPGTPDEVSVQVTVARGVENGKTSGLRRDGTRSSGVHDLRLFRDGQMVGYQEGEVALDANGKANITFHHVKLPRTGAKEVEFSAYAFNIDLVKSETYRRTYKLPVSLAPQKGRAYLINIGVNAYEEPAFNLTYAADDARQMQRVLAEKVGRSGRYANVVPVLLTSDYEDRDGRFVLKESSATKANVKAVLDLLAGKPVAPEVRAAIPNADKLHKATPEDMILLSFSSHGVAGEGGSFYLIPYDIGQSGQAGITPQQLQRSISSDELSQWLRDVDGGEMVMIVDACHSAKSVEGEGFKPGPMGSRGLGQLAYDKGMRILAATQADDVALENDLIKQGLLTHALVHDGIQAQQADYLPKDKKITLDEWLGYGVQRVPSLHEEVHKGQVQSFGVGGKRDLIEVDIGDHAKEEAKQREFQHPSLFDFKKNRREVLLMDSNG